MGEQAIGEQEIANREHIAPQKTGDNIAAKRVATYGYDGINGWQRTPTPFIMSAYDDVEFTNPDANGNYQTISFIRSGVTNQTLALLFDGNSNVTSIIRA